MYDFAALFRFELKKLTGKKILWVSALMCLLGISLSVTSSLLGTYYVNGEPVETHYQMFQVDRAYREALSGRAIDTQLLQETADAYACIPTGTEFYTVSEEYQTYARPYSDIFNLIRSWTGMELEEIQNWEPEEEALYGARMALLERDWTSIPLTEGEQAFWRSRETELSLPLTYRYHEGYETALDIVLTVGVLMLLFVSVCLSNTFSQEHTRRIDQLILSSAGGKTAAYWAKLLAGIAVALAGSTVMALLSMGLSLSIFGWEGFETPFQIYGRFYSLPLTMGGACLIAYGLLILTSILAAVFVMVLSEWLRSGTAALAVSTALVILGGMVNIPSQYRVAAQVWDWLPMTYLTSWNIFDARTLPLFGRYFLSWQAVPFLYVLCAAALALGGKRIYQHCQISGR
ncbi:MAG: ABC transporter permease [Oscillibacter sp.]|nr:ABC transporter permease [Oscillibacter sp.]